MFSKEWFVYVFGRWILLSGIAGSLLQYLFSDKMGIQTIPAFLLNQLLLAFVFWYVEKYIFRRHFSKIKATFKFPRIRGNFNLNRQYEKISEEYSEYVAEYKKYPEDPERWLHQFLDLFHSVEMTERVLREKGVDVDKEYYHIIQQNQEKGLYNGEA